MLIFLPLPKQIPSRIISSCCGCVTEVRLRAKVAEWIKQAASAHSKRTQDRTRDLRHYMTSAGDIEYRVQDAERVYEDSLRRIGGRALMGGDLAM